jgi:hypothetical protein
MFNNYFYYKDTNFKKGCLPTILHSLTDNLGNK